jgi:hypothetical protein
MPTPPGQVNGKQKAAGGWRSTSTAAVVSTACNPGFAVSVVEGIVGGKQVDSREALFL